MAFTRSQLATSILNCSPSILLSDTFLLIKKGVDAQTCYDGYDGKLDHRTKKNGTSVTDTCSSDGKDREMNGRIERIGWSGGVNGAMDRQRDGVGGYGG